MHLDFELTLSRNTVEAPAAGVTLYSYDAETITRVLADTLESSESVIIHHLLKVFSLDKKVLLILLGLIDNILKFFFLGLQNLLIVVEQLRILLYFLTLSYKALSLDLSL